MESVNGIWNAMDDRALKQSVQQFIAHLKDDQVTKTMIDGIVDAVKSEAYQARHEFNQGPPDAINCANGELSLVDGQWVLGPHVRDHYRTTRIPVAFDPGATAPRFKQFLFEIFDGDTDAIAKQDALLEMIGYTLMAHCQHEKFVLLIGGGANGKSVVLGVLAALLGRRNIAGVQPSQFDNKFQRAHLHNKLANIVSEIKQGAVMDDAALKAIVSGEVTTVEHKFQPPFEMKPFATCWFGTNHMPHTRDFSDALFRRAMILTFNNVFSPDRSNCDPGLKEHLVEHELPGILILALNAYGKALRDGFTVPRSCQDARDKWRLEADQVRQFVDDKCLVLSPFDDVASEHRVTPERLYTNYQHWAGDVGVRQPLTRKSFLNRLAAMGHESKKSNGVRYVVGLELAGAREMAEVAV